MSFSLVPFNVRAARSISDGRATMKDVYVLETDNGRRVFSQDTGTGWNWLSGDYIEPLVYEYVRERTTGIVPSVVAYDLDEKWMVTEYIGAEDLRDSPANNDVHMYETLGALLGTIHSLNDFDGYGGLVQTASGDMEPQDDTWSDTLVDIIRNRSVDLKDTSGRRLNEDIVAAFADLDTSSSPACLSHGDFNPRNIRISETGAVEGVIDWQYAWVSDGLCEFFYRRLRFADEPLSTDRKTAAFTRGYRHSCPLNVLSVTPEQATASYIAALAREQDWRGGALDAEAIFEQYGTLDETIAPERLLRAGSAPHLSQADD